jgi:hypothetical protein
MISEIDRDQYTIETEREKKEKRKRYRERILAFICEKKPLCAIYTALWKHAVANALHWILRTRKWQF